MLIMLLKLLDILMLSNDYRKGPYILNGVLFYNTRLIINQGKHRYMGSIGV